MVRDYVTGFQATVTTVPGRNNLQEERFILLMVSKFSIHMVGRHVGAMIEDQVMVEEVFILWKTSSF